MVPIAFAWAILALLVILLLWESVRLDAIALNGNRAHRLPWALGFLGLETTGTLAGGLAALLFARGQFFRQTMPTIGASTRLTPIPGWRRSSHAKRYTTFIFNAGPGVVRFDSVRFNLGGPGPNEDWLSDVLLVAKLLESGLVDGKDFILRSIGPGAPLPAQPRFMEGIEILIFGPSMRAAFPRAETRIRVRDASGNLYERVIPLTRTGVPDGP